MCWSNRSNQQWPVSPSSLAPSPPTINEHTQVSSVQKTNTFSLPSRLLFFLLSFPESWKWNMWWQEHPTDNRHPLSQRSLSPFSLNSFLFVVVFWNRNFIMKASDSCIRLYSQSLNFKTMWPEDVKNRFFPLFNKYLSTFTKLLNGFTGLFDLPTRLWASWRQEWAVLAGSFTF